MKINNITRKTGTKHTTLSADITFGAGIKENLYLRVANKYKHFVVSDANPFLAALLLPSMRKKEDLTIEGDVSPKLLTNTRSIMNLVEGWKVGFEKVSVKGKAKSGKTSPLNLNLSYSASFFTGGVDSFYTFLKHNKKKDGITHFIFIHGCDIPLENKEFFDDALKSVQIIAKEAGVEVIVVETNMRTILEQHLEWEWELGSALSSVALFLSNGLKKVYIPSGLRSDQLGPYGTHPELDPLFSTEKLEIIHDGCESSRIEKVANSIAKSPLALKYLRVCCQIIKGKYNCNECVKCEQTKMELLCAGALNKAKTLTHTIDVDLVRKAIYNTKLNYNLFPEDILKSLKKQNLEPALQEAVAFSIEKSKHLPLSRRGANLVAEIDKKYLDRRIYKFVFGFTEKEDRTFLYKFLSRTRLIS